MLPSACLQSSQARKLARSMISRHLHLQRSSTVAEILSSKHSTLLTDQQSCAESVAANVVWADTQIRDLQALNTVDIQTLVKHTMLHDIVALPWCHRARSQRVPGRLTVPLYPLLNSSDVLSCVRKRLPDRADVAVDGGGRWVFHLLLTNGDCPRSVLDIGGDVVWTAIGVSGRDVHVSGAGCGTVAEVWVHPGDFAGVGLHAAGCLTRLDVTPNHGCHVTLVVHETGIEVGGVVGVGRRDVCESSGEWVFQEVEHCEELASGHVEMVAEPTCDNLSSISMWFCEDWDVEECLPNSA